MPPRSGWAKRPAPQSDTAGASCRMSTNRRLRYLGRRPAIAGSTPLPGGLVAAPQAVASASPSPCCLPARRSTKAERRFARLVAVYAGFSPDLAHSIPLATPSDRCEVPYGLQDTGGTLFGVWRMPLARSSSSLKALFVRSPTTIPGLSARSGFSPWLTGARGSRRRRNWSARSGRVTANRS